MRRVQRIALSGVAVLALTGGLIAAGTVLAAPRDGASTDNRTEAAGAAPALDPTTRAINRLQTELVRVPGKYTGWSELGFAYLQQARLTADPSYYGKADGAFAKSLSLRPDDNDTALAGQASLAASRHDFADALVLTTRALKINNFSPTTWAVRTDALNELGRYDDARTAVQRVLDLNPGGVDGLTRASYVLELSGDTARAAELLTMAAAAARAPADIAFAQYYLGELAWNDGNLTAASAAYEAGLAADPGYLPLVAGRAQVLAARGDTSAAAAEYRRVVEKLPTSQFLLAYGELLQATGQQQAAQDQYAVLRATSRLYAASGQDVDTEQALFEADHGTPAAALASAQKAYAKRPEAMLTQDAYSWALHVNGRDAEALPIARASVRRGWHQAPLYYRLGVIEAAVGNTAQAKAALTRALDLNPMFSPLYAPKARALLDGLG